MSYRYRCELCGTTSPPVHTRAALAGERQDHRDRFHGGHIPDGEAVVEPPPFRFSDVPPAQRLIGTVVYAVLFVTILVRFL